MPGTAEPVGGPERVRLGRAPLGLTPTLRQLCAAVAPEPAPFVLQGRWGLPEEAGPAERVIVAGASPRLVLGPDEDAFDAFDRVPQLEGDAPAGAIGGGLFGWLGFDLGRQVERTLGPQPSRPLPLPAAHLAWYDDVLRRDSDGVWWVETLIPSAAPATQDAQTVEAIASRWQAQIRAAEGQPVQEAALGLMTPHRGAAAHRSATRETVRRIHAGELFQANVCLRLEGTLHGDPAGLAPRVLEATDPWFGAWMASGPGEGIVSASPERFLRRRGREVVTGPIKGTAPRSSATGPDRATAAERDPAATALARSEKDRAEHVMIVDLMRNDLGRACDYGSIWFDDEPRLEPHAGVWHLVSQVGGRLHDGLGDGRLLRSTFPPGSVTGAPKVQAMRVIAAVEGTGREVYTGAHGFASPAAGLDLAVTIRTVEATAGRAWVGVGGGIVADSGPEAELQEALGKAAALVAAAGGTVDGSPRAGADAHELGPDPSTWMRSADRRPDPRAGLLETVLVMDGRAQHLRAHLTRLDGSLRALGLPPSPVDLLVRAEALAATAVAPARLRILVRENAAGGGADVEFGLVPLLATGIGAGATTLAPAILPGGIGPHKYLDRALIDTLTARLGATPLLLDADGAVLEAGWANLWWLDDQGLATPPADGRILPGVTRGVLLDRAAREGAPVAVREAPATFGAIRALPLLLTSARGVSVARLPGTPQAAVDLATDLAAQLAPLVADD